MTTTTNVKPPAWFWMEYYRWGCLSRTGIQAYSDLSTNVSGVTAIV
jgi:hypothetical protein